MAREDGFFDELARGLADGTLTRGKALRLMGAALVGGSLASLGMREAGADRPGCKRLGKHCTRDEQCCGNLVCPSGTCQTPTTTTTETPTTTTTETPTTTTTSTTTMCLPNGRSCTTNGQCCSGRCADSTCAEPCFPETVLLSNGTCARPCTSDADCPGCAFGCADYCSNGTPRCTSNTDCLSGTCFSIACTCTGDTDCPTGQFCTGGLCFAAC
jgi:hypothetical protein